MEPIEPSAATSRQTAPSNRARKLRFSAAISVMLALLIPSFATAQNNDDKYGDDFWEEEEEFSSEGEGSDSTPGYYVKGGIAIGVPGIDISGVDADAGAGLSIAGGMMITPWLASEVDLTFTAGSELEFEGRDIADVSYVALVASAKFYPLGLIDVDAPEWFQPYASLGVGAGQYGFDSNTIAFGDDTEGGFVFRFVGGSEFMVWNKIGLYFEAGYDAAAFEDIDGSARVVFGGTYRF